MEDTFSYWMRDNLKSSSKGLITQDLDFACLKTQSREFFFIEEKNSLKAKVGPAQKIIFQMFKDFLSFEELDWKFLGTALVVITEEDIKNKSEQEIEEIIHIKIKTALHNQDFGLDKEVIQKLWDCKGNPINKPTARERSKYRDSLIKGRVRLCKAEGVLFNRIDWIFVNYCSGYFIFIDEINVRNRNEKKKDINRQSFIEIIDSIFTKANSMNIEHQKAKNPKSNAVYKYLGFYRLEFDGTNPYNSNDIKINNKKVEIKELSECLNLETDRILNFRV